MTVEPSSIAERTDLQDRPPGPHQSRPRHRIGNRNSARTKRAGIARPDHLQGVHVAVEIFRDRIEAGERQHRAAHQPDAGQPAAAHVRCLVFCDLTGSASIWRKIQNMRADARRRREWRGCQRVIAMSSSRAITSVLRGLRRSPRPSKACMAQAPSPSLYGGGVCLCIFPSPLRNSGEGSERATRPVIDRRARDRKPSNPSNALLPALDLARSARRARLELRARSRNHRHRLQAWTRTQPDGGGAIARNAASMRGCWRAALRPGARKDCRSIDRSRRCLRLLPVPPSLWVTRRRPKIDRVACPWLIRRFLDPQAQFLFVDPPEVAAVARETGAIPFDIEGVSCRMKASAARSTPCCGCSGSRAKPRSRGWR